MTVGKGAWNELMDLVPDKRGGLNGSTQHSGRTHLALKTKAKIAGWVRSVGTSTAKQMGSSGEALSNQRIGWCFGEL
jgi:hypothetical protein